MNRPSAHVLTCTIHRNSPSHAPSKTLVDLYQWTKFRVASSKYPQSKGVYIYLKCTCVARHKMHPMHPTTKWHAPSNYAHWAPSVYLPNLVSIAKNFLQPGKPSNTLSRSWCAQPAPQQEWWPQNRTRRGSIQYVTCQFGISGVHRLAYRGGKRTVGAKYFHVHCTCKMHPIPLLHTAPNRPYQGAPMYRVWCP